MARALRGVLAQTLRDWELLLVDDGSTDQTIAMAAETAAGDARVRIVRHPHGGIVAALNIGCEVARGRFCRSRAPLSL